MKIKISKMNIETRPIFRCVNGELTEDGHPILATPWPNRAGGGKLHRAWPEADGDGGWQLVVVWDGGGCIYGPYEQQQDAIYHNRHLWYRMAIEQDHRA